MGELYNAMVAFVANMKVANIWDSTIVMIYGEFGRTVAEISSVGTDHGGAQDIYLIGPSVKGGVYGSAYANSDFSGNKQNRLTPTTNMLDIFRPLVGELGYDPNKVFEIPSSPKNLQLFV